MADCTVESVVQFIRENSADCKIADKNNKRSDFYINCAIRLAVLSVIKSQADDFQETIDVKLKNGECIQSTCDRCSGNVRMVGNVNGNCDDPIIETPEEREKNAYYNRVYGNLTCKKSDSDEYAVEKFSILGDGGCEFKVEPKVPDDGEYVIKVLCVVEPDISDGIIPPRLCRHLDLVLQVAFWWIYMFEADPAMATKANSFITTYQKFLEFERDIDRDVFVESIKFGQRIGTDEQ